MKIIGENAKKLKFSEIWRIFTEKSASDAENGHLWKITKNVTTHHQIVRFGSFLDMLILTTSRIDFYVKVLIFSFFSEKSRIFRKNGDFGWFLLKIHDFLLKTENMKILTQKSILLVARTNIFKKWAKSNYLVMSCNVFRDFLQIAIFSMGCWIFSENPPYFTEFSLFSFLLIIFKSIH